MSRSLKGFDHVWRALVIVMLFVLSAESWYVRHLSDALNDRRVAQSVAVEQHISDNHAIAVLKRELVAVRSAPCVGDDTLLVLPDE